MIEHPTERQEDVPEALEAPIEAVRREVALLELPVDNARLRERNESLGVSETFYSIQGEGKTMGVPAVFVRLGGCNLLCGGKGTVQDGKLHGSAKWRCDTIEVWMKQQQKRFADILNDEELEAIRHNAHVVITGGEPTMQQDRLVGFIQHLQSINPDVFIEMETNGTIYPDKIIDEITLINCSPKLNNSGEPRDRRYRPEVLERFNNRNAIFKFVIAEERDMEEVHEDFSFLDPQKVYLMPAGENLDLIKQNEQMVAEQCRKNYFNYSGRLHINIWDKKTGV